MNIELMIFVSIMLLSITYYVGLMKGFKDCEKIYDDHTKTLNDMHEKHRVKMEKLAYERGLRVGKNSEANKLLFEKIKKSNAHCKED